MGVLVVGLSRTGTSMMCGLLAKHGVFFGQCTEPSEINQKGFFENVWLKQIYKQQISLDRGRFYKEWLEELKKQRWNGKSVWGAKAVPKKTQWWWMPVAQKTDLLVVVCHRPWEEMVQSRLRAGFQIHENNMRRHWRRLEEVVEKIKAKHVFHVRTDLVVKKEWDQVKPIFGKLKGVEFSEQVADEWVDPNMWGVAR